MVLDRYRSTFDFALIPIAKKLININPNMISQAGLILAFMCGSMTYFSRYYGYEYLLLFGALFAIISGYFDVLDGKIAKLSGKISSKGDYIDHMFDRYSDVFMIGGVAFNSRWCDPYIGMMAIIGILLTSYIGTQAQAIGISRIYSGLLGRADRIAILTISMMFQFMMFHFGYSSFNIFGFNTCQMEIMMLWFVIAGNITAIQRAIMIWIGLNRQ